MRGTERAAGVRAMLLVDEAAPGFSAAVAEHDPITVGDPSYRSAVCIAKSVAHAIVADFLSGSAPDIAKLVAQPEVIPVSESIKTGGGGFFLELEKTSWYTAVNPTALKDSSTEHQLHYGGFVSQLRLGICLRTPRTVT
jgi:hypothetical protein